MKKPKFRPKITRIKLDPEQAVLSCDCYNGGLTTSNTASNPIWNRINPVDTFSCIGGARYTEGFRMESPIDPSGDGYTLVSSTGSS